MANNPNVPCKIPTVHIHPSKILTLVPNLAEFPFTPTNTKPVQIEIFISNVTGFWGLRINYNSHLGYFHSFITYHWRKHQLIQSLHVLRYIRKSPFRFLQIRLSLFYYSKIDQGRFLSYPARWNYHTHHNFCCYGHWYVGGGVQWLYL